MTDYKNADECEKQCLLADEPVSPTTTTPPPVERPLPSFCERLVRHVIPCFLLLLSVSILFRSVFVCHHRYDPNKYLQPSYDDEPFNFGPNSTTTKIALEAHIMSKCPDARDCLQQLVVPAMAEVGNMVDFKLSYIGTLEPNSDEVHCKHGPSECLGNIIQLCAAELYPEPIMYLGFANCMTSQYSMIPDRELIKGCAMEHGIDFQKLNACISQEGDGMKLLRDSVKHSQEEGVSISCTVRLDDKVRCVRDGGEWKDCPGGSGVGDLVADIKELYEQNNRD